MGSFAGFDRDAFQFFHELSAEMNREWFEENKERYQRVWAAPMEALLDDVSAGIGRAFAPTKLVAPKVFRIYRDVRFAKDKTPYKLNAAGKLATTSGVSAVYVHLGIDEEYTGAGTYYFEAAQVPRWRKLAAAQKSGTEIGKLIAKLRKAGYTVGGHENYKRVPAGFAQDHPRAELLRMRGLTAAFPPIPKGLVHKPAFAAWLVEHARRTAPLATWLTRHLK